MGELPIPVYSQEKNKSRAITISEHELIIEGPGYAYISVAGVFYSPQIPKNFDLRITPKVIPGAQLIPITLTVAVKPKEEGGKFDLTRAS